MKRLPFAVGAALLMWGSVVTGHEGATGMVKQRMDEMKLMGRAAKRIHDRLQAKRAVQEMAPDAEVIAVGASRMLGLFPPDTVDGHTEATAAVWERWPEFAAQAQALADASGKLANGARSGQETIVLDQFRAVSRSCSECHRSLRASR